MVFKEGDDEDDEQKSEPLILSIGEDGKAAIHKPEDFVEMHKDDADLMKRFIEENKDLFDEFMKRNKKGEY